MRKVMVSILAVAVLSGVAAGEGHAATFDRLSVTGVYGYAAYQNLGDIQSLIDDWNESLGYFASIDQSIGNPHADDIGLGYSLLGDVRYRLGPRFLVSLRVEYVTDNSSTLAPIFGNEYSAAGVPITLTGIYEFPGLLPGPLRKAKVNLGVGAGPVMRGIYKFEFYFPVRDFMSARATSRGFQIHTLAEVEYPLLKRWSVAAEMSYRYTRMGDLTYRSISGETENHVRFWEGSDDPPQPGFFPNIPFPEEGAPVIYTPEGDVMKLDFSGFNFRLGVRLHLW